MANQSRFTRALCVSLLWIVLQSPTAVARPCGPGADPREQRHHRHCFLEGRQIHSGWQTEDEWAPRYPAPDLQPTAYEIGNGQVQVSYLVTTAEIPVTNDGSTVLVSSVMTSYYTYTAVPREATSASVTATPNGMPTARGPSAAADRPPRPTSPLPSLLTSLTTSEVQSVTRPAPAKTSGHFHTSLETSGNPTVLPFQSLSLGKPGKLSLVNTRTWTGAGPTITTPDTEITVSNIFQPIATGAPPPQISSRSDHPVPRLGIQQQKQRLQTNKFYGNFYLGDQTGASWTHPYSVGWAAGGNLSSSYGLAVSHIERSQLTFGPPKPVDAGQSAYFEAPLGVQSLILSAVELSNGTTLTTDNLEAFSVNVNLIAPAGTSPLITFPLVQGMGFVTGIYNSASPLLGSMIGIENMTYAGAVVGGTTFKYRAVLADGFTWLIYVTPTHPAYHENSFTLVDATTVVGPPGFDGYIQVAKVPAGCPNAEQVYDESAGVNAKTATISGSVHGTTGNYTLSWKRRGPAAQSLLMFALPHHVQSFAHGQSGITNVQLMTTTKGLATAVQADSWTLVEPDLPIGMSFDPWRSNQPRPGPLSPEVMQAINDAATIELAQDVARQTNTGSTYFDGKALAKFAAIVYATHKYAKNNTLALTGLMELEAAFALHVSNEQDYPLVYDTAWGGAVSISSYLSGNAGDDFGNTYYNDHHFHYGYFLYAASVIAFLRPAWLHEGTNKAWTNMLARDYANSVSNDPYFPFSRMFDWYHGHSWAEGLFASADGKNQESSSEDTMASYGIKMWGLVTGDKSMEARGNLMVAVQARSLQNYFLYLDSNEVQPAQFVGNKVSGILFENKIDHTTYFGDNIEYIQGIHMLPLMPMSTLIRTPTFVQQEWTTYNFGTYVETLDSGWRGILVANWAIVEPEASYAFFSNVTGEFNLTMLDGGASQTWYLAWSAVLGGAGGYGP